jgi:hypothetical protein
MNDECTPPVTPCVNSEITLGWSGSSSEANTTPLRRSAAPSRVCTRNLPSGVVMMSFTRRVFATSESTTNGDAGFEMSIVYITSPPPPEPR